MAASTRTVAMMDVHDVPGVALRTALVCPAGVVVGLGLEVWGWLVSFEVVSIADRVH